MEDVLLVNQLAASQRTNFDSVVVAAALYSASAAAVYAAAAAHTTAECAVDGCIAAVVSGNSAGSSPTTVGCCCSCCSLCHSPAVIYDAAATPADYLTAAMPVQTTACRIANVTQAQAIPDDLYVLRPAGLIKGVWQYSLLQEAV